ncbi:SGNH/GDSL hydrolase family protein [Mucilaginibacter sp. dw_454]|uniref:SGNH/GDSL hydrolase family protein n=1 Tax=Mucilaginibacter sp. dw_454 TaxID=2720079 RepID=UPI001BD52AEA|nr:SGNH/GDSL hydrolase family protein [Mucilaginibacter sp. dw_454]
MRPKFILPLLVLLPVFIAAECRAYTPAVDTNKTAVQLDTMKIVYFGSSVPYGFGATNNFGYTYMFSRILQQRAASGLGKQWNPVNKSIGGDNTIRLMKRWHRDFVSQHGKYVLIALSLGNEMLHEQGKSMYDQFKANLPKLIAMARDSGYTPVVTNCYTRNDFNDKDYYYTKQMDLWIHTLDVPSINLLGGIDDGTGKWAAGYWYNDGHPNDAGHQELAYTIVPSLFDALSNGKALPKWVDGSGLSLKSNNAIDFKPENIVHPFTTTINIKADGKGQIIQLKDSLGRTGSITITDKGVVKYTSPLKEAIVGNTKITDGQWHKITLTHYYAHSETALYCDSTFQGHIDERIVLKELSLGSKTDNNITVKNWLFYRSGMNIDEVKALANNTLLKSSLELYAPLDNKSKNPLANLAQSTNTIKWQ